MSEPTVAPSAFQWNTAPSQKAKNAVQRSVTALLDELAPERVVRRVDQVPGPVELHRTPNGCILQASECAVSVSWFAEPTKEAAFGEIHVLVWQGKLARRGTSPPKKAATLVSNLVVRPVEPLTEECTWHAAGGTPYNTAALAAHCLSLLDGQIVERS